MNITEDQLFDVLGFPEIEPLVHIDGTRVRNGLPTQLVKAAEWVEWIDEDDEDIRLLDIGEGFLQGEEPRKLAQPGSLRVPETILADWFDYRVDLWRTGCMVRRKTFHFCSKALMKNWILDLLFLIRNLSILVSWRG